MARLPIFNPVEIARQEADRDPTGWQAFCAGLRGYSLDDLRAENARLQRDQAFGVDQATARVWALNQEFTRRGIGPRWRGAPEHVEQGTPDIRTIPFPGAPAVLTEAARRRKILRWVDVEWLRHALGQAHPIPKLAWTAAFTSTNPEPIWLAIVEETGANSITLAELAVPKLHQLALLGFQTSTGRDRFRTLNKFLAGQAGIQLAAQMTRRKYAITADQHADRIRDIQAIEIAEGSPTDAALIRQWMTGESVTRQAMAIRRKSLAGQVPALTRRKAWK